MVYIPFIYFLCLLIYFHKKTGAWTIDVAATSILAVISFCGIVIDTKDLYGMYGNNEYSLNLLGIALYCIQWTIVLFAFHYLARYKFESFPQEKQLFYRCFIIISLCCLFILLFFQHESILEALTTDDAADVRAEHYEKLASGEKSEGRNIFLYLPGLLSAPPMTTTFLLLCFYSIIFVRENKIWRLVFLFIACLPILLSTLTAGRAAIIYFVIEFYLIITLFWKYLSSKQRRGIIIIASLIGIFIGGLFITITFSRFDTSTYDPLDSLLTYSGQHINNFCAFILYGESSPMQIGRIFPLTYKLLGHHFTLTLHYEPIEHAIGIPVHNFSSFGGEIFLDLGMIALCVFLFGWVFFVNRPLKKQQAISFPMLFLIGMLCAFFSKGLFAWPFVGHYCTGSIVITIVCYIIFKYHFKFK